MEKYYLEDAAKVLRELKTTENGLSEAEAEKRLAENGKNKLQEAEKKPLIKRFIESISDPMIIMLLTAAAIQAVVNVLQMSEGFKLSEFADVIVIMAVVVINTIMSLIQESKAEDAMDALMQMTASTSKVLRDNEVKVIKSEDIVVGDVIIFEAGDTVPADCRVLEAHSLKSEEAALTGESVPVNKIIDVLMCEEGKSDITLGDRHNMLYNGSTVVYGRGKAVVTACGMDTEMGKIASALTLAEKELTPLQKKMGELSAFLTKLVIIICVLVFLVGVIETLIVHQKEFSLALLSNTVLDTFIAAIALAVAAIPEGLPAVVTIILSIGVSAMAKRQALIRKLTAVETLGCTNIICTDKTGTLTQNKMTVVDEYTYKKELLATAMALCSDATIKPGDQYSTGEPTECALVNYANSIGLPKYELEKEAPRCGEAPFDSNRKMMSTIHPAGNGGFIQYTKGALDVMLDRCENILTDKGEVKLDDAKKAQIMAQNKEFASRALRVLCAAYRTYSKMPASLEPEDLEHDLVFIGIVGMIDPCREEVYDAIKECRSAGIRPVMITGDHKDTAVAIGKDLGIIENEEEAIEGHALDQYSDEEMIELVPKYSVYARVQPEHKTRIVNAWKARSMVTAMTGDGVNDAPSIKASDIGIGMGITGTDVTKSVADMVLADDNFATIVNAVEEGRKIYDNVCKVIQFQLSTNLSEVVIMFVSSLLNFTLLTPVHLLWINMVTDSLPGLALGMEKAEGDVMKRKPRNSSDGIFSNGAGVDMVWQGIYISIIELASYFIGLYMERGTIHGFFGGELCVNAVAMAFLTVNFAEICCAINLRSQTKSIFSVEMIKNFNWWLFGAVIITVLITLAAIYMPGLNTVFGIVPGTFEFEELMICVALALSTFPAFEIGKLIRRKAMGND
ncbi:MAG: calcium-translocating P-type ATPase, PMCA-type [Erysipelotrichaceae bacterium]|nr:calcium-translocating P-type ATPase, PMCA-type [Erysipelotrichaceae bacterium]